MLDCYANYHFESKYIGKNTLRILKLLCTADWSERFLRRYWSKCFAIAQIYCLFSASWRYRQPKLRHSLRVTCLWVSDNRTESLLHNTWLFSRRPAEAPGDATFIAIALIFFLPFSTYFLAQRLITASHNAVGLCLPQNHWITVDIRTSKFILAHIGEIFAAIRLAIGLP